MSVWLCECVGVCMCAWVCGFVCVWVSGCEYMSMCVGVRVSCVFAFVCCVCV